MADTDQVSPRSREEWREWLAANHDRCTSVWLVMHRKDSGVSSVRYEDAVEEALCFGWIDSKAMPIDANCYRQYFSVRKAASPWSSSNKGRVERLIAAGRMTPAGLQAIEAAKANGMWTALDAVEALELPAELAGALEQRTDARKHFDAWSRSDRRVILQWIALAKREETRTRRVLETADCAARNEKPGPLAYEKRRREANKR